MITARPLCARDAVVALCEPVHPPSTKGVIEYFCGDPENENALEETEEQRLARVCNINIEGGHLILNDGKLKVPLQEITL